VVNLWSTERRCTGIGVVRSENGASRKGKMEEREQMTPRTDNSSSSPLEEPWSSLPGQPEKPTLPRRCARSTLAALATVLLVSACANGSESVQAKAATESRLVIRGALMASTQRVAAHEESCGYRADGTLLYQSDPLLVGSGSAVARVELFIRHYRGRGTYSAVAPTPYKRAAAQVVTADDAARGVGSAFFVASDGTLAISAARGVGARGERATLAGKVRATLQQQHGTARLVLSGSWHCEIEPLANGVP
jgi:hypothetical protein